MPHKTNDSAGRTDLWVPYFSQLEVIPQFNIRTDYGDLEDLSSIESEGVKTPLRGWRKGGKYYITEGHRRYAKLAQLFEKDGVDRKVPFMLEPQKYTDADRIMDMLSLNTGKQLTPLEQAEGIIRLKNGYGKSEADIARTLGKSRAYINRLAEFSKATPEIRQAVLDKTISATTAVDLIIAKQQDTFIEDLKAGVYDKPSKYDLFSGNGSGSAPALKASASTGKTAQIKKNDIKKQKAKGEVAEINSWAILKNFIKNYEGTPSDPAEAKTFLFIGKVINNKIDEEQLKRKFKK